MGAWLFVSDLHGRAGRYRSLFRLLAEQPPTAVLLGGDLLPGDAFEDISAGGPELDFAQGFLVEQFEQLRVTLRVAYPRVFMIPGNDDPRGAEVAFVGGAARGLWEYMHLHRARCAGYDVLGYACVPPTPFLLKDWERYDVSRHVDPGCVSPEEGIRTVAVEAHEIRYGTIQEDLAGLAGDRDLSRTVCLFHAPPYDTVLDRAALDGKLIEHVPLDVHVGSVAIKRFIEERQPRVTLHGHIHEAPRLMGTWRAQIGRTHCFSAAHDGPELAVVKFDPDDPTQATRELL